MISAKSRLPSSVGQVALLIPLLAGFWGRASANWPADGVPLCVTCDAGSSFICSDGLGGAFVAWNQRDAAQSNDVYVQRVSAAGQILVPDGLPVATGLFEQVIGPLGIAADGAGGALLAWYDFRNESTSGPDIYAQRVTGNLAPVWSDNGAAVTILPGYQSDAAILNDAGGAFVTWYEVSHPYDIYIQRLRPSGEVASGWPPNGLAISTLPVFQGGPEVVTDGAGGVILAWGDLRDGTPDLYAQRITADGQVLWAPDGVLMMTNRGIRAVLSDGSGGALALGATLGPLLDEEFYLQRFTGDGAIASGWPENGVLICSAPNERQGPSMVPDGFGGVLICWSDYRDGYKSDVFLARHGPNGQRMPGWPENGLRVNNDLEHDTYIHLAPDGLGGAFVCWDASPSERVSVQHVTGIGVIAPGWPTGGLVMPGNVNQERPRIVADGQGGAILAWTHGTHIRAQRVGPGGIVATAVSLETATSHPDRIEVTWRIAEPGFRATVQRRDGNSNWLDAAELIADGAGRLTFVDRDVTPGARYAYRLRYRDESAERYSDETWVEMPPALALALQGLSPNPGTNPLAVSLVLPDEAPASLEVFDITGRRVAGRELRGTGPGRHHVRLNDVSLSPGVYVLRLTHGGRILTARGVVTR